MNLLVTGGAGYVGTELLDRLAHLPEADEVVVYDNLSRHNHNLFLADQPNALPAGRVRFVMGDLLDSRTLRKWVERADVIYHLAAKVATPFSHDDPHVYEQVNHWGTAELSYLLEDVPPKRVVYLSSTSVYGPGDEPADHTTPPRPESYYGISKRHGEEMLLRLSDRHRVFAMRSGNVYGYSRSMRFDAVINRLMFDAHFSNRISVMGTGEQRRSFIHVDKLSRALVDLLKRELTPGTYNLVERELAVGEVVDVLRDLYPDLETLFIQQTMRPRSLRVLPDERLAPYRLWEQTELRDDLEAFRARFAFVPRR
ncbi:MAG: SDR family oxidoreductase [Catalinimonas sp.]